MRKQYAQFQMRLPHDLKDWIAEQAEANLSSQNSEIIRAIRERMERDNVENIRAKAQAMQAHADLLEAEGLGLLTEPEEDK